MSRVIMKEPHLLPGGWSSLRAREGRGCIETAGRYSKGQLNSELFVQKKEK